MQTQRKRNAVRRRAFTLLEVLMVIVILGVLAALIIPQFSNTGDKAREDLTRSQINAGLSTPLETFKMHCGRYPTTEEGLSALLQQPSDEEIGKKWGGPYVKQATALKDAWTRELIYKSPGEFNQTSYDLSSPGKNGVEGDEDDITNWTQAG